MRQRVQVHNTSYMAPEQAKGGNIGPAMDLYAVGVMAFEMFTGRLPFLADSVMKNETAWNRPCPDSSRAVTFKRRAS